MENESKELMTYSPQGLISQALAQGLPVETLERLMDLSDRWEEKQAKAAFFKSLSVFQSKCPELVKQKKVNYPSKTGGNVNYNYAPLGKITKSIQSLLLECELSYRWEFQDIEDKIKCTCIVTHSMGHSENTTMTAGKDTTGNKNDIQSIGSTRTYLQRYTLIGALGLSTADQDNDGQTGQPGGQPKSNVEPPKQIDKVLNIISKVHIKTKVEDLHRLDDLIMTIEALDKRKEYLTAYIAQLKKVGSKYEPEILIK